MHRRFEKLEQSSQLLTWQLCFHNQAKAFGLWERMAETLGWTHSGEELCALSLRGATVVIPLVTANPWRWQVMVSLKRYLDAEQPRLSVPLSQRVQAPSRRKLVPSRNSTLMWIFCTINFSDRKTCTHGIYISASYFHCYSKEHQKWVFSSKHLLWRNLESSRIWVLKYLSFQ